MLSRVALLLSFLAAPALCYVSNLPLSSTPQLRSSTSNYAFRPSVGPTLRSSDFKQTMLSAKASKAMADGAMEEELDGLSDEELRRRNLQMAVEEDGQIQSPFESGGAGSKQAEEGGGSNEEMPFTIEGVDKVLDEVRPYLIADGGNCKVMDVDAATGIVSLRLEGACGTCPSSTVTLKMGIERALKEKYGAKLSEVVQVQGEEAAPLSADVVYTLLEPVKGAVEGLGGSMEVTSVDAADGKVTIAYKGPEKLTYGIELTLKDDARIRKVEFV